jgi:hypothetical protein
MATKDGMVFGGGGLSLMQIVTVNGDYLVCQPFIFLLSVTLQAAGSGYKVGDVLSITGGTGTAATLLVTAISGGGSTGPVSALALLSVGAYSIQPGANPLATTDTTTGTATGCTVNCTWDGAYSSNTVNVAKPRDFRQSLTARPWLGVNITYTWTDSNTRSASDGTNTEAQYLIPPYQASDLIFVGQANATGVQVSSTELTAVDLTARWWGADT